MTRSTTCVVAIAVAMLPGLQAAHADTVKLANGDRLSGKILQRDEDRLVLQTPYAGALRIKRSDIAAIEVDEALPIAPAVRYKRRLTLSATQARGNSSSSRLYGEADLGARASDYRYALGLKGTRSRDTGITTASNALATGNYDRFTGEGRFVYGRGSLERDRFRGIDQRASAGGGYGLQLFDSERTQLSVRGGLDAVWVARTGGTRTRFPALGWGLRWSHWLWQRRVEAFHDQDGFWNLKDTRQATLRSRTGLRVPIAQGLTASAQLNVDWERQPAPGRKATDSTLLLGLGYEW